MNSICQTTVYTADAYSTPAHFKRHLKLPITPEEWEEADHLLSAVVPLVLQAITAEEKNSCLCTAIYDILSTRFGTHAPSRSQNLSHSRLRQHDRALKEVTRLKNEARRALRKAKREGASGPTVQSLTGKFLSLLRQHSRLNRDSSRRLQHKEAKLAREQCHHNFWKFAKELFDGGYSLQRQHQSSRLAQLTPSSQRCTDWLLISSGPLPGCHLLLFLSQTAPCKCRQSQMRNWLR